MGYEPLQGGVDGKRGTLPGRRRSGFVARHFPVLSIGLVLAVRSRDRVRLGGSVFAAGDVANHDHPSLGRIRVEHWDNAIEQGKFTSNIENCDLRKVAAECATNNQTHATRKEIVICTEEGGPIWGRADRNATMQILDNLISNAVKFSPHKSTVQVKVSVTNGYVGIGIKDQGPGLSAEDQKKLFGKFTRLSAQPTGGESSTGLGLSIVKKLAEAMAGTVICHSVLGEGATFTLRLPACDNAEITLPEKHSAKSDSKVTPPLDFDVAGFHPKLPEPKGPVTRP